MLFQSPKNCSRHVVKHLLLCSDTMRNAAFITIEVLGQHICRYSLFNKNDTTKSYSISFPFLYQISLKSREFFGLDPSTLVQLVHCIQSGAQDGKELKIYVSSVLSRYHPMLA